MDRRDQGEAKIRLSGHLDQERDQASGRVEISTEECCDALFMIAMQTILEDSFSKG